MPHPAEASPAAANWTLAIVAAENRDSRSVADAARRLFWTRPIPADLQAPLTGLGSVSVFITGVLITQINATRYTMKLGV